MTLDELDALVATSPHRERPLAVPLREVLWLLRKASLTSALSCEQREGQTQYRYRGQLLRDARRNMAHD